MKFPPLSPRRSLSRASGQWIAAAFVVAGSLALWSQTSLAAGGLKLFGGGTTSSSTGGNKLIAQSTLTPEGTNGPTLTGELCMQNIFGTPVTNANKLNCSANDIRIARAIRATDTSCIEGDTFDLTATFQVVVTANVRYDAAFFFRTDGGDSARGDLPDAGGQCSLSSLDSTILPAQKLDGDLCGDLTAGSSYEVTFTIPDVLCQKKEGTNLLSLPNCVSWHSNQGTACSVDDPKSFKPDTKSKCNCDDALTVPVEVETPGILVTKTAGSDTVPETGGQVTFDVLVKNDAEIVSVAISTLTDSSPIFGPPVMGQDPVVSLLNIQACGANQPNASSIGPCTPANATSCATLSNAILGANETASCQFALFLKGNTGDEIPDTVRACANSQADGKEACASGRDSVIVTDIFDLPTLTKTAAAAACQVDVNYMVSVTNNSPVDSLTINSLTDDRFGNITSAHGAIGLTGEVVSTTCGNAVGTEVEVGEGYDCSFVGRIQSGDCSVDHLNTVTAGATDDDGKTYEPANTARVRVNSMVE